MTPGSNKSITSYVLGSLAPCSDLQTCSLVPATLAEAFINYDQADIMAFFSEVTQEWSWAVFCKSIKSVPSTAY